MPEPERSFAGYTFHQRLSVGFYGTVYRAVGGNHQEARILQIDPGLSQRSGFVEALERFGSDLGLLEHKNVQATVLVGRTPADQHVVVNEATPGAHTLEQILTDGVAAGATMSAALALAVGRAVVSGLTHSHSVGIVHGAVHPRSVLVDYHGGVKLADFAAARALAQSVAKEGDPQALKIKGFLAPELVLGDPPSVGTDVYAAGALLHMLLSGSTPPGRLDVPRELAAAIEKAVQTAPEDRFPSAIELRAALRDAVEFGGAAVASVKDLANFIGGLRGAAEANLDQETEDVLASLAPDFAKESAPPVPRQPRAASVRGASDPGLESALDELVAGLPVAGDTPRPQRIATGDIVSEDDDEDEPPTNVDRGPQTSNDPVSAIIRADRGLTGESLVRLGSEHGDEDTYIPPAMTESDVELAAAARAAVKRAQSEPRIAADLAVAKPAVAKAAVPRGISATDLSASMLQPKRSGGGLWILTLVVIGAIGGVFLYLKTKDLPESTTTVHKVGDGVRAGNITVSASEPEAAVWLKLGRTPLDTLPLSAADVHQVRVEHEGYAPADISVLGSTWSGSGTHMRAVLSARLEQARPGEIGAAYPPAPQRPKTGREGRGILHITSTPPGAHAYLLVGFTPDVQLRDVQAGQEYEFKIAKAGFTPGFVVIRAEDWRDGEGFHRAVERTAELAPLPAEPGKKQ